MAALYPNLDHDLDVTPVPQHMTAYQFLAYENTQQHSPRPADKPLPSLPSPTLTNPDMVLPNEPASPSAQPFSLDTVLPVPSRSTSRSTGSPVPAILPEWARHGPSEAQMATIVNAGSPTQVVEKKKKDRMGLMSRKMMLLRPRTGSGFGQREPQPAPRSVPSEPPRESYEWNSRATDSPPTLMDVGNLAPEPPPALRVTTALDESDRPSTAVSSANSDDVLIVPSFLANYENDTTDDDTDMGGSSPVNYSKYGYSVSIEGGASTIAAEEQRKKVMDEEERNSAVLSKRAEQILANAKKRLNLMEGNLRGARDLVAPLTAANLRRATSLGSANHSPAYSSASGGSAVRTRAVFNAHHYEPNASRQQTPLRPLTSQASSPTLARDSRLSMNPSSGAKDVNLPERPHTALERATSNGGVGRANSAIGVRSGHGRIPVRPSEPSSWAGLRSTRSHDSLGSSGINGDSRASLLQKRAADLTLGPLQEDDGTSITPSSRGHGVTSPSQRMRSPQDVSERETYGLGITRPASRQTEDLREQMSSLKGKISTLRERAREDSLRRRSEMSLRTSSPFSNASPDAGAPEYYFSPTQEQAESEGKGTPTNEQKDWWAHAEPMVQIGNAFTAQERSMGGVSNTAAQSQERQIGVGPEMADLRTPQHRRTQSGRVVLQPATSRYEHHRPTHAANASLQLPNLEQQFAFPSSGSEDSRFISPLPTGESDTPDYFHEVSSEDETASVYEDAEAQQPPVVPHEERSDAFDYEEFLYHSAMKRYTTRDALAEERDDSRSASSVGTLTARAAPQASSSEEEHTDGDDEQDAAELWEPESGIYPPATPQTPERLREIERKMRLHKRTLSADTVDTYATADEGEADWPISSTTDARSVSPSRTQPRSRPQTAIDRSTSNGHKRGDSGSERADSGIGLGQRSRRPSFKMGINGLVSPPMSHKELSLHDPVTLALQSLMSGTAKGLGGLGLKDRALVFGVVEQLRGVIAGLAEREEIGWEARRRIERVGKVLRGET